LAIANVCPRKHAAENVRLSESKWVSTLTAEMHCGKTEVDLKLFWNLFSWLTSFQLISFELTDKRPKNK